MSSAAPSSVRAAPVLEDHPCPVRVPPGTRCGYLVVPQRRDVPQGPTVKVGFAVHRSTAPGRGADPIVYTSGGPASGSIPLTGYLADMFPDRDVVVLEQRGSRWSQPRLDCPETVRAVLDTLATPGQAGQERGVIAVGATACRDRLGVDLRGFRTGEIAADVVDLRQALGYARWNLFGVSYSTRSMLAAAAADPQGTRSVVLDSFLPAGKDWYDDAARDLTEAIGRLAGQRWPDLPARFERMVDRLNRDPAVVTTDDPLTGRTITVRLTGDDVATVIGEALREAEVVPIVPVLIDGLADGRDDLLQPLADAAGSGLTSHEFGLYHAVQCQDEAPDNAFAPARPQLFTVVHDQAVCDAWKLPGAPAAEAVTTAPVLVVGGRYDPTTPTRTAEPAARALPNARFVEFAGVGHAVFLSSRCGRQTIAAFVADPAAAPPCDPARAAHRVIGPERLHLTTAVYRAQREPWTLLPFGLFVLTALVQLGVGLARPRRRLPALVAGVCGLTLAGLTADALYGVIKENEVVLGMGVPAAVPWYGLLAWAGLAVTLAAAWRARTARASRRTGAGGLLRDPAAAHLLAAVIAAGFLAWWHLHL
ncbi:alpha/beta hydrolase [Planomonospora parontospora]|uniref:alpha/beta hydrolase n=1 Tax=Planomonospora parontospora TaxID=58119 RepID=UPI001780495E|nr:alpha/beta hydrolase [Planomonospora parontospora]